MNIPPIRVGQVYRLEGVEAEVVRVVTPFVLVRVVTNGFEFLTTCESLQDGWEFVR